MLDSVTEPSMRNPVAEWMPLLSTGVLLVAQGRSTLILKGHNNKAQRPQGIVVSAERKYHGHKFHTTGLAKWNREHAITTEN